MLWVTLLIGIAIVLPGTGSSSAAQGGHGSELTQLSVRMITKTANYSLNCGEYRYCQTDDREVWYAYSPSTGPHSGCPQTGNSGWLESVDRDKIYDALFGSLGFNQTAINAHHDISPVWSGTGETDIIFMECSQIVPEGFDGLTRCDDPLDGSNIECDQAFVYFRGGEAERGQGLPCHEIGHAVGFVHPEYMSPAHPSSGFTSCSKRTVTSGAALSGEEEHNILHIYG